MNGAHDCGGMHGFGPIAPEPDEPVFHHDWERRAFALITATPTLWNSDEDRYACESQLQAAYLTNSYYHNWIVALERMLVKHQMVSADELRDGKTRAPATPDLKAISPEQVEAFVQSHRLPAPQPNSDPQFAVGSFVQTRNMHPHGHTRLPRYARSAIGQIARINGAQRYPDTAAHSEAAQCDACASQWVYSVAFSARELWGGEAPASDYVHLDLWEDYLGPTDTKTMVETT